MAASLRATYCHQAYPERCQQFYFVLKIKHQHHHLFVDFCLLQAGLCWQQEPCLEEHLELIQLGLNGKELWVFLERHCQQLVYLEELHLLLNPPSE